MVIKVTLFGFLFGVCHVAEPIFNEEYGTQIDQCAKYCDAALCAPERKPNGDDLSWIWI